MDKIQHLRAEIEELKTQRQDYRELNSFYQAETQTRKEQAEKADTETVRMSERLEQSRGGSGWVGGGAKGV
jgi:chromosome segregation ATPase